jgi:hypothetical protein
MIAFIALLLLHVWQQWETSLHLPREASMKVWGTLGRSQNGAIWIKKCAFSEIPKFDFSRFLSNDSSNPTRQHIMCTPPLTLLYAVVHARLLPRSPLVH